MTGSLLVVVSLLLGTVWCGGICRGMPVSGRSMPACVFLCKGRVYREHVLSTQRVMVARGALAGGKEWL